MINHVYISPHFDDAVFSCGGVICQQTSRGERVVVITVCGGAPQGQFSSMYVHELHERWGTGQFAVDVRRKEDRQACDFLGASVIHLPVLDAIYRTNAVGEHFYASEEAIFGKIHPEEIHLIDQVAQMLEEECANATKIYAPVGYGGHVDHRLTRKAVEQLGKNIWFYRDYPYAIREGQLPFDLNTPLGEKMLIHLNDDEITRWARAVMEYRSQLSTFWSDPHMIEEELRESHHRSNGIPFIVVKGEKPRF